MEATPAAAERRRRQSVEVIREYQRSGSMDGGTQDDRRRRQSIDQIRSRQRGAKAMTDSRRPLPPASGSCSAIYLLVNLCALMLGADMAVLPAAYREIGDDLAITPAQLGLVSLGVGITSNIASLLPALFAGSVSRPNLVASGCLLWAASAALMGLTQSYHQLLVVRAINGVGVGIVSPLLYSLVADTTAEADRGGAFGPKRNDDFH